MAKLEHLAYSDLRIIEDAIRESLIRSESFWAQAKNGDMPGIDRDIIQSGLDLIEQKKVILSMVHDALAI